ncbi:MAG: hypothetical protein J6I76_18920 [Oribacterium sp.]|nr:hypothetical protein [Oribacterium sp.]
MKKIKNLLATVTMISVISSMPCMANMIVYTEHGSISGSKAPMTISGQWTQVGNDYGYSLNGLEGKDYLKGLIQKGGFRASDGDWYMVDETTHTIKRNYWATGYDHDEWCLNSATNTGPEIIGARTYYNADGKAEKIQFPLRRGAYSGNAVFDESESKFYDIISSPDTQVAALIDAVNKYRSGHGASKLENDKALLTISNIFSSYLPINSEYTAKMTIPEVSFGMTFNEPYTPYYRNLSVFMYDGQGGLDSRNGSIHAQEFISVGKWDVNEIVQEWANQKISVHRDYQSYYMGKDIYEDCTPSLTDGTCVGASCYVDANGTPYWYMLIG